MLSSRHSALFWKYRREYMKVFPNKKTSKHKYVRATLFKTPLFDSICKWVSYSYFTHNSRLLLYCLNQRLFNFSTNKWKIPYHLSGLLPISMKYGQHPEKHAINWGKVRSKRPLRVRHHFHIPVDIVRRKSLLKNQGLILTIPC